MRSPQSLIDPMYVNFPQICGGVVQVSEGLFQSFLSVRVVGVMQVSGECVQQLSAKHVWLRLERRRSDRDQRLIWGCGDEVGASSELQWEQDGSHGC